MQVTNTLDSRINKVEELLIGRAEAVTSQIEVRSKAAADALNARLEQLSESIRTNAGDAGRALGELATATQRSHPRERGEAERTLTDGSGGHEQDAEAECRERWNARCSRVSAEVARSFAGKAEEISSTVSQRAAEMTGMLDQKQRRAAERAGPGKSEEFAADIGRVTDHALGEIQSRAIPSRRPCWTTASRSPA